MSNTTLNPAEIAANDSIKKVFDAIDQGQNFLLEAGAGAGKTHSLIKALEHLISSRGTELLRKHQRIAAITYTNIASDEIQSRIDGNPAVLPSTIHAFCWSLIKDFQPALREAIKVNEKWVERCAEQDVTDLGLRKVGYSLGYPKIKEDTILLGHGDVISMTVTLLENKKFREVFTARFPVLFIDEYQDTNKDFAAALKKHFLDTEKGPQIGLFGDHWQKIYGDGCGKIDHPFLVQIGKGANFRSSPVIVESLNRMRPELQQEVRDPNETGSVAIYHTNSWAGTRLSSGPWKDDLPPEDGHRYLEALKTRLAGEGWNFDPTATKILMLTHSVLAKEQGYSGIVEAMESKSEKYARKEDDAIKFLVEVVEPVCEAYETKRYGEMFSLIGGGPLASGTRIDKAGWVRDLDALLQLRAAGKIGAVIDLLKATERPGLPDNLGRLENKLSSRPDDIDEEDASSVERLRALRDVPYREITALARFIDEATPFATKHGVKGAEFENVLVIFGRGWAMYDFNQMLEWAGSAGVPNGKEESYERNRNLFYVACSRPKSRLALLFTQKLSAAALATLTNWFGSANIHPLS